MAEEEDRTRREDGEKKRRDRELLELVQELRVALTGVQILFAFLLTVPFTQRFSTVTEFQRQVYFFTLIAASGSVVLLIAPTAHHRWLFRQRDKEALLLAANHFAIGGLVLLAGAMTGAVMLITDLLFKGTTTIVVTAAIGAALALIWFVIPIMRRIEHGENTS